MNSQGGFPDSRTHPINSDATKRLQAIFNDTHYECCKKCLDFNATEQAILDAFKDKFPALEEFQEENSRFKQIAEGTLKAVWPDRP